MQPYIGEIRIFAGNFAPLYWHFCDGSLIPVEQNETLFNLLGTTYGGDGINTFALPDLRGRLPLTIGQSGTSNYSIGEVDGAETVTLSISQLPAHSHIVLASDSPAQLATPSGTILAAGQNGAACYVKEGQGNNITLNPATIGPTGGGEAHTNMMPSLALNFIISLYGNYPQLT